MAQLRDIFLSGLETILDVFEEAIKIGTYEIENENEFTNDIDSDASCKVRCIFEQFREKDISLLRFSDMIQPNDILALIPYEDMTLEMKSSGGYITFTDEGTYTVVGFEKDPMNVTYTVLLRKN